MKHPVQVALAGPSAALTSSAPRDPLGAAGVMPSISLVLMKTAVERAEHMAAWQKVIVVVTVKLVPNTLTEVPPPMPPLDGDTLVTAKVLLGGAS